MLSTGSVKLDEETMIFIHSSFRTSSTYMWSEFRNAKNCLAYGEFYHECLAELALEKINGIRHDSWYSKHPQIEPYLLEFAPLIRENGGVKGFEASMSYDAFIPRSGLDGSITQGEVDYISLLVDNAKKRRKIPVFSETRTLGRFAGLKAAFPGLHIFLYRNMFQQWCSYTEQEFCGNRFFVDATQHLIIQNQHDDFLVDLANKFPVETATTLDRSFFYRFIGLHLYLYKNASSIADLIIDINSVAKDDLYRTKVQDVIRGHSVELDLSGARDIIAYSLCDLGTTDNMLENIGWLRGRLEQVAPAGSDFVENAISEMLREHQLSEHYTRFMRGALLQKNSSS